jgi:MinD-like ATPase involved in chromosome partitioning or flagellar assembly
MPKIVCFHSFRGGVGKTTVIANLGAAFALLGKRVGIIDFDLKAPAMQSTLRIPVEEVRRKLNDYLLKKCDVKDLVLDVSKRFGIRAGGLFFVPASFDVDDIVKMIEDGYEASLLGKCVRGIANEFGLDYVLLDTHSGMDEDVILSMAISDIIIEVVRIDEQSLTGALASLEVIRKIGKKTHLLANMVPKDAVDTGERILEERLKANVLGTIPFFDDIWAAKDEGIFVVDRPSHRFSIIMKELAEKLLEREPLEREREKERASTPSKEKLEPGYY